VLWDQNSPRRLADTLLDNAIKYTSAPGKVTLSAGEDAGRGRVMVEDTGIGITRDDQARIFERTGRQSEARNRELGGTGLGLAIAQWIVQIHKVLSRWRANRRRDRSFWLKSRPQISS